MNPAQSSPKDPSTRVVEDMFPSGKDRAQLRLRVEKQWLDAIQTEKIVERDVVAKKKKYSPVRQNDRWIKLFWEWRWI